MLGLPHNQPCADMVCLDENYAVDCDIPVPPDTIDYTPPAPESSLDNKTICPYPAENPYLLGPSYGLDQGLPPYYTPMMRVPLKISGTVKGSFGKHCQILKGATIEAWHVDVGKFPLAVETEHPVQVSPFDLKDVSCRGYIEIDETGSYEFTTTLPASYGPPRHINFMIKADGFEPLTTRLYFADDWRLQQTAPLEGEPTEFRRIKHHNTKFAATMRGFTDSDDDSSQEEGTAIFAHRNSTNLEPIRQDIPLPGVLANDPRVRPLELMVENTTSSGAIVQGYYRTEFNIVLKPLRPLEQKNEEGIDPYEAPVTPATDISGLWSTRDGGLVKVETSGHTFIAIEWPHIRKWGTVAGVLNGDTIRGVDFRSSKTVAQHHDLQAENMSYAPWTKLQQLSKKNSQESIYKLMGLWNYIPDSIWNNGMSTGAVIQRDEFSTNPLGATIRWSGNDYDQDWSRVVQDDSYRYLKLDITRETGGFEGGRMVVNEITFYEGILGQRAYPTPDNYMENPRYPAPQVVTCSSFATQEEHCFRAFDGIDTANSTWITKPVGSRNHVLSKPQYVLIDIGKGRGILPTALKIVCDSGHPANPKGCPMTFVLSGSNDNIRFKTLFKQDYYDYNNEYANGGAVNHFYWSSSVGRTLGHRCGSCDVAPTYLCKTDRYDSSCASRYCGKDGLCALPPVCEAGFYLDSTNPLEADDPVSTCMRCPPGRYGNVSGLRTPSCTGPCKEGYYCVGGATTPTQYECGHVGVFCPEGSSAPIPSSAGRRTVSASDHVQHYNFTSGLNGENQKGEFRFQTEQAKSVMIQDSLCKKGHYCIGGEQLLCPEGTYGNSTGLATIHCTDVCRSGTYCPPGSVSPITCSRGHYCPDGSRQVPCPAGTFGATRGLKDRSCSGHSKPGFYAPDGSSVPTLCPAGKYGESPGLRDSDCSGDCDAGYYCPGPPIDPVTKDHTDRMVAYHPNVDSRQHKCGSPDVYCPKGSDNPIKVLSGYYSAGGVEDSRSTQMECESGFYCVRGIRHSCPAGTYGSVAGIAYENMNQNENICSGFCDKGYYCPVNSTSATQYPCPPGTYGNPANHSGLGTEECSGKCPLGYYCPAATVHPIKCPAGRFGNSTGLTTEACAAACEYSDGYCDTSISLCDPGHYCPAGSLTSTQYVCGHISKYCPKGSAAPIPVDIGYYSVGPVTPRSESALAMTGVSVEYGEYDRFPEVLYTEGVLNEFWAIQRRTGQKICEKGYFCTKGAKTKCPAGKYGSTEGLTTENCTAPCPLGHYCPEGTARGEYKGDSSIEGTGIKCPAGRYGGELGLKNELCSDYCADGFVCPRGSSSAKQVQCGSHVGLMFWERTRRAVQGRQSTKWHDVEAYIDGLIREVATDPSSCISTVGFMNSMPVSCNRSRNDALEMLGNLIYCTRGTDMPVEVMPGYYTIGGNSTTRSSQLPCPPGSYCNKGIIRECPAGRYGSSSRLTTAFCTGPCSKGHYCPAGSTIDRQNPCPIGRYGSTEGLKTAACTDSCKHPLDCNLGSVYDGYLPSEKYPSIW